MQRAGGPFPPLQRKAIQAQLSFCPTSCTSRTGSVGSPGVRSGGCRTGLLAIAGTEWMWRGHPTPYGSLWQSLCGQNQQVASWPTVVCWGRGESRRNMPRPWWGGEPGLRKVTHTPPRTRGLSPAQQRGLCRARFLNTSCGSALPHHSTANTRDCRAGSTARTPVVQGPACFL